MAHSGPMWCWQDAQLTITVDGRTSREGAHTIVWHDPGQGAGENYSDNGQTVLELVNRFGAGGWQLAGLQDYRDGDGTSYREAPWLLAVCTFKRPVPEQFSHKCPASTVELPNARSCRLTEYFIREHIDARARILIHALSTLRRSSCGLFHCFGRKSDRRLFVKAP